MRPIEFGSDTIRMKEVPPGAEATFSFNGDPSIIETEYGMKYSFPITLLSHPDYPLLKEGPIDMVWESKSACAKQLWNELDLMNLGKDEKFYKAVKKAYDKGKWKLARFDSGIYKLWIME
jgi:hypothetical protein